MKGGCIKIINIINYYFNRFHGNIRSSNILLTSSNHVYLTDFGIYKPLEIS